MAKQKSRFPSYGLVRGPSHKHGGVAGVVAGEQPVELEGGEWIIPKEVVPDYLPVLKQITNEGRAIQNMDNGNSAMDALIASASMETGLSQPKSPMYQEGGEVGFEQIADLAKLYGEKQGIKLNPADYTPEGGRSKEGYARKFGLPEGFTIDTLAYGSPANYSLKFLDAGGEKLGTSRSTGIYPILQDIRAAQINSRLGDKVSLENMSEYMKKQREDSELRDMFRTLIGSAERNYPKEKQKQQGGPVDYYQNGGFAQGPIAQSKFLPRALPSSSQAASMGASFGDYGAEMAQAPMSFASETGVGKLGAGMSRGFPSRAMRATRGARGYASSSPETGGIGGYTASSPVTGGIGGGAAAMTGGTTLTSATPSAVEDRARRLPTMGLKAMDARKEGGPIKQYGHGGQMQPRKQQEMRNPEVYGPPVELMGPAPDTTGNDLQHMLNQLMMRDVNDSIGGPFSQKAALKRAIESGIIGEGQPLRRKYQEGGMVEQQQAMGPVPQGSLMGAANGDARIRPLTPDTYITKLGEEGSSTMEIPKLSTAYLQSFGMETPLSKQQGASLHQKGITPDTLNPSVTGLINRVLVQRLANEDE